MKIIALRGKANTGKSTSLKMLIDMFDKNKFSVVECAALEPYSKKDSINAINDAKNCLKKLLLLDSDIYAVFNVNDKYIGITTQGDSAVYLNNSLNNINKAIMNKSMNGDECAVFICSVRTYGNTCDFVSINLKSEALFFLDKATLFLEKIQCERIVNLFNLEESHHKLNELQAKEIFSSCKKLLKSMQ